MAHRIASSRTKFFQKNITTISLPVTPPCLPARDPSGLHLHVAMVAKGHVGAGSVRRPGGQRPARLVEEGGPKGVIWFGRILSAQMANRYAWPILKMSIVKGLHGLNLVLFSSSDPTIPRAASPESGP